MNVLSDANLLYSCILFLGICKSNVFDIHIDSVINFGIYFI
ncbi:hypothetical protein Fokcrypt_00698 [Candidatus Fokinia cryptica]|uniref:Uncharacterized protein n=1 Tax=Candidatus Fokinia crypta TaxID=1920990 RepID=A0ABZ0UQK1_9RICK|nr:hypothetical protein Fokcrypt_00698 [Candidatus Fokinia cryptica]